MSSNCSEYAMSDQGHLVVYRCPHSNNPRLSSLYARWMEKKKTFLLMEAASLNRLWISGSGDDVFITGYNDMNIRQVLKISASHSQIQTVSLQQDGSEFTNDCFLKAVSSDGKIILFQSQDQEDLQLYQRNLATGVTKKLSTEKKLSHRGLHNPNMRASLSSDGLVLTFSTDGALVLPPLGKDPGMESNTNIYLRQ